MRDRISPQRVARMVRRCLNEGLTVQIDGLGAFRPTGTGQFAFDAQLRPKVFIAYAEEDLDSAKKLYRHLEDRGLDPWLDKFRLLPGQNWPRAIERAIRISDYFLACFSRRAVTKRGTFQSELRYALDCARRQPLDRIFLIPVRLEDCTVPEPVARQLQYVDLFPDWEPGLARILAALARERKAA